MIRQFSLSEKIGFLIGAVAFSLLLIVSLFTNLNILILLPIGILIFCYFLFDIRFLFYTLIFSLPVSVNLAEFGLLNLDFPDEILMILSVLFGILFAIQNRHYIDFKKIVQNPLIIIIILSFGWTLITVIFSENPLLSLKYFLKKIWFIIPFIFLALLLLKEHRSIIISYQLLIVPTIILCAAVLIRFSAVGFSFDKVHDPIQPFFTNHVVFGAMTACIVPLAVGGLFLSRTLSVQWLFSLFGLVIILFAVYFSYSRAAWMSVLFAGGAFILIRFRVMHYAMLVFYAIVLTFIFWLSQHNKFLDFKPKFEKTIMHESLEDHIMATIQGTDISSAERYYRWIAAVKMSADRPLVGVGPNNFYDYYKAYSVTSFKTWVSRNFEKSTTHNYFLFMLVEQGYPAMLLYGLLMVYIFYYGQKVYQRCNQKFDRIVILSSLCMLAAFFINNFFSELVESDKIGSLFYLGIAIMVSIDLHQKPKIPKSGY